MPHIDDLVSAALQSLGPKPSDDARQADKKRYSERASAVLALAFAEELRRRGMRSARPTEPGHAAGSGAERRMAGGIGAKKVDVTWATEESGLLLGISVKTINFRDRRSGNYQKNLINRRSDMLMEAVTLHRRFPYAILAGFMFFDKEATEDQTERRLSTFANAHNRLRLFTGREDPAGRDEQYERLYLFLLAATPFQSSLTGYPVGSADQEWSLTRIFDDLVQAVAERNPDFYDVQEGILKRVRS
jgi:hypothetical protein